VTGKEIQGSYRLTDEEFVLFELAYQLKMKVVDLLEGMPYIELLGWMDYFERRPAGWREDDRIFKILQTQGVKGKPEKYFPSLAAIYNARRPTDAKTIGFKGSAFFNKLNKAKGGVKLDILNDPSFNLLAGPRSET
jgi:hypothetical protein